jgi:hypothetical protein
MQRSDRPVEYTSHMHKLNIQVIRTNWGGGLSVDRRYGLYFAVDLGIWKKKSCRFGDFLFLSRCRYGHYFAVDLGICEGKFCRFGDFESMCRRRFPQFSSVNISL